MQKTITPDEMKRLEENYMNRTGTSALQLMERAARHVADAAAELAFEDVEHKDLCSAVQSAVLSLPEDQRTAIIREFWYGQKPDPKTRSKAMKSLRHPSVSRALRTFC